MVTGHDYAPIEDKSGVTVFSHVQYLDDPGLKFTLFSFPHLKYAPETQLY